MLPFRIKSNSAYSSSAHFLVGLRERFLGPWGTVAHTLGNTSLQHQGLKLCRDYHQTGSLYGQSGISPHMAELGCAMFAVTLAVTI
jgi:hypothetical protein